MKRKILDLLLVASVLVGALGFDRTAQAVSFSGNTSTSSPTTIDTFLTYTSASFSNLDVPIGPGSTSLTDLGHFTLNVCSGNNCQENFGTQDGVTDFIFKITFTDPIVPGSPEQFTADIFGKITRSGNSNNIGNGSLLTIDFNNTAQHLTYTNALGSGAFDLSVNDPSSYTSTSAFGDTRTVTGQIANLTFTPSTPDPIAVPEPGSAVLLGLGAALFSLRRKRAV